MCSDQPQQWHKWLALAVWWYNTHFHTATGLTPYEVVYNQQSPLHLPYLPGESDNKDVDRTLQRRESMITELKHHLCKAQSRMKSHADQHSTERVFDVGAWVWLKLKDYKQMSVCHRSNAKLGPKYCGPFQVTAKLGPVAYKLKLPSSVRIHDVFHVSQLKEFRGILPVTTDIPQWLTDHALMTPADVLSKRQVPFQNAAKVEYLIRLHGKMLKLL